MDSALLTARAACCGGCAAATGRMCSSPLWNKWNFRLFHFCLVLDRGWWPAPWTLAGCAVVRAFLKKLKILNIEVLEFCEFRGLPQSIRWLRPPLPKAKSRKSQTSQFAFLISFFLDR
ncbi:MAG: hypothetical protein ACRD5K_10180 [Candidatus Acidiferrales bacterium]